jgi:ribosome biogenesis protein Tsr3
MYCCHKTQTKQQLNTIDTSHSLQQANMTYTMTKDFSTSPQLTLRHLARFHQVKAMKRARPVKHILHSRKAKKNVSFSTLANVQVRPISREELSESWIQPEEYSQIDRSRKRSLETLKLALVGEVPCPDPTEFSGLEQHISPKQVLERKLKNMQYRRMLLEEQHMQRSCGVSNPEAIQALSELFSQQASRRAQQRALSDNAMAV